MQGDSTPLRALKEGCLYRLRSQHPVIDYVAVVTDTVSKQHWLLLLQVSLSKYTDHTAKAGDLKRNVKGPEMGKEQTTWLQYYQALAKNCLAAPILLKLCTYMFLQNKLLQKERKTNVLF